MTVVVLGGLLIAIFIMPTLMIMTFCQFRRLYFHFLEENRSKTIGGLAYYLQALGSPFCYCSSLESLDIDKKGLGGLC